MSEPLRLVFWELTAQCNLACRHCRAEAQPGAAAGELTTGEILAVARDIRAAGDPILILTGGEPLVRPDFFDIASACATRFTRVALATNGTVVDDAAAHRIAACGVSRVSVSLDGACADTHDAFRGQPGSFVAALRGITALRRAGLSVQVNATVSRHNVGELDDLLDLAQARGADAFHLFVLVPVGCGVALGEAQRLSPLEVERVLRWLHGRSVALHGSLHLKATCAPQYYRILAEAGAGRGPPARTGDPGQGTHGHSAHGMNAVTRGCLAGSAVCFISRTGDVQPCGYLPLVAGNVRMQPFGDIWASSALFGQLRDPAQLHGVCGACTSRTLCGGCRARAYAATGDPLAGDPDCILGANRA